MTTNTVRDVIMGRWKSEFDDIPRLKSVRAALDSALHAHDAVRERHATLAKNQHLSPLGRLDDVRAFVSKSTAPVLHRSRAKAKEMREEVSNWKNRLQPAKPDPNNVSAAVLRSEMRTHLRSLSPSARTALVLSENPDPTLIQAVLEAPNFSSGVSDEIRARMVEIIINRDHPEQLVQIAQTEEAIELLDAATGMAWTSAKSVSEFPSEKLFDDFLGKSAPPPVPVDPLMKLFSDPTPPSKPEKTPEQIQADAMAWARDQVAAMRARGEFD